MHENKRKALDCLYVSSVGRLAKPCVRVYFVERFGWTIVVYLLRRTIRLDDRCVGVGASA